MISRKLILSAAMLAISAAPAFADADSEAYVQSNADDVLASLNAPELTPAERRTRFQTYMDKFTNIDVVAKFVIGSYAKKFSDEEMEAYLASFRAYALAVYEDYFNEFGGQTITVLGSNDRSARESVVATEILRDDGDKLEVSWHVLKRRGEYHVVDVHLKLGGQTFKLGVEQRAQFKSILDQNYGSADVLIAKIDSMTDELIARRPPDAEATEES